MFYLFLEEECLLYADYVDKLKKFIIWENEDYNVSTVPTTFVLRKSNNYTPAMGSQVTVMSIDEKKLQKKINKKQKKNRSDEEIKEL